MDKFYSNRDYLYNLICNINNIDDIPREFEKDFLKFIDKITLSLLQNKNNFYGHFLIQMKRKIKYDMASPTGVDIDFSKYIIYFNPILFLNLTLEQMQGTIKHEIHHIIYLHLIRKRELINRYSTLALNMAMDIVVNQYIDYLPPYAITLETVNLKYNLSLEPYQSMEYYVQKIQEELNLMDVNEEAEDDDSKENELEKEYDISKTHDIWNSNIEIDENVIKDVTRKSIEFSQKGDIPIYVENALKNLKNTKSEISWNLVLKRIMGTIQCGKNKTIMRRNRRQPYRVDLRGELSKKIAKVLVAIDISGSISDDEYNLAIKEIINIVRNYNYEITILECDTEIRREYKISNLKDIRKRLNTRGGTKFSPIFKRANEINPNVVIYFTDGKGEETLAVKPKGYKVLWVLNEKNDVISLKEPIGIIKKLKYIEEKEEYVDMLDVRSDGWSMNNQQPIYD